jgi:hypothetical protein
MQAYIARYDGRKVSKAHAVDAFEYALDWARRLDGQDVSVGVIELLNMVTLGLATHKPE